MEQIKQEIIEFECHEVKLDNESLRKINIKEEIELAYSESKCVTQGAVDPLIVKQEDNVTKSPAIVQKTESVEICWKEDNKLWCKTCSVLFCDTSEAKEHNCELYGIETLLCKYCNILFSSPSESEEHNCLQSSIQPSSSSPEERDDNNDDDYTKESDVEQEIPEPIENIYIKCIVCNQRLNIKTDLQTHTHNQVIRNLRIHKRTKDVPCCHSSCKEPHCAFSIVDKSQHLNHDNSTPKEREKESFTTEKSRYSCDVCRKSYKSKTDLKKHTKRHKIIRPFSCGICNKQFTRKHTLALHIRTHTGDRPYSCEFCKKSFYAKSDLKRHLTVHSDLRPFTCDICNKSYSHKSVLIMHLRTHTGDRPFDCDICHKSFFRKYCRDVHMKRHMRDKPHSCDICMMSFDSIYDLNMHMLIHYGQKQCSVSTPSNSRCPLLRCFICKETFKRKKTFSTHMFNHLGIRPYRCVICNRMFSGSGDLKRHIRSHTGYRPFRCEQCNTSFSRKYILKAHMATHKTAL